MLEYFTLKKAKKHREQKAEEKAKSEQSKGKETQPASGSAKDEKATEPELGVAASPAPQIISTPADNDDTPTEEEGTPVLDHEDEKFLERLTSPDAVVEDENETPPPLPPRVKTPVIDIDSDDASSIASASAKDSQPKNPKGKEKEDPESKSTDTHNKSKRFSYITNLSRNISLRRNKPTTTTTKEGLQPDHLAVPSTSEADKEKTEMARVLDDLDLSAKNNRAFSLSTESAEMARRFTQVLKDLVNGVPTAYGDLVSLLEDRDGVLARTFDKLPSSLKKLVAQLPEKLTSSFAPEILAVAAEAQGLSAAESKAAAGAGLKGAAKKFLTPSNLHDLVTRPGALAGLLKGIVNALKTRFPAFVGTNVLWSLAVFLLLSMLWYCYKRGREVRLEREASEASAANKDEGEGEGKANDEEIEGRPRVEELPDDPMLNVPAPTSASRAEAVPTEGNTK
ncbi:hypothetical protein F4678DRAFT_454816 [Xylaria arbuscula]|nr:hypothetical protein F4678DRAFT_454816 [Xylaria arbuscula]